MEYNGTSFSFLTETGKRFIKLTKKTNQIIHLINSQNEFTFNYSDAVKRFEGGSFDLDSFCSDETLSFYLLNSDRVIDSKENREIYYLGLRKHLLTLKAKK